MNEVAKGYALDRLAESEAAAQEALGSSDKNQRDWAAAVLRFAPDVIERAERGELWEAVYVALEVGWFAGRQRGRL
jgi:hypothetical protein